MPIHPLIVHFPIALITVAFFADLFGYLRNHRGALTVGWTCLLLGLITTLLTVIAGVSDMNAAELTPESHRLVHLHLRIGLVLGFSLLGLTIWRAWLAKRGTRRRAAPFLMVFAMIVALLTFQGWYGGELAYSHGVGVAAAGQGMAPPDEARERLREVADAFGSIPGFDVREQEMPRQNPPALPAE